MPFGLTYAAYVMGIGLSMVFGPPDTTAAQPQSTLTLGTVVMPWAEPGSENFLTFSHTAPQVVWGRFHPVYAVGLSDQGAGFVSTGLGRRLDILGVKVTAFAGPALFVDNHNNDLLQFRTGFDINQPLGDWVTLTGGYYHISNGQANVQSADIDVAHLGFVLRF
jgi:hypothetical protein